MCQEQVTWDGLVSMTLIVIGSGDLHLFSYIIIGKLLLISNSYKKNNVLKYKPTRHCYMYSDSEDEHTINTMIEIINGYLWKTKLTCDVLLHPVCRTVVRTYIHTYIYIYVYIYICIQKHRYRPLLGEFTYSPHKGPVARAGVFRSDDVIMNVEFCIDIPICWSKTLDQFCY